ncbi:MAG: family 43 glycosylhydrolase [Lachnospiraceae bacterium]
MEQQVSAATKRATTYPKGQNEWYCNFSYGEAYGLGYEPGVNRRDPSNILIVGDLFYVWYTKSVGACSPRTEKDIYAKKFHWDYADVWYATSPDGIHWEEKGCAVHRGNENECDGRTVCTPDVMEHDGKFYLVYQTQRQNIAYSGSGEGTGMAVANTPDGPWEKIPGNILEPIEGGYWYGEDCENYNYGLFHGLVHDPSMMYYNGKFYLYYKCGSVSNKVLVKYAGRDTRIGVAISDSPTGPFVPHPLNPLTNSGHETMLWQYDGGVCVLLNRDGPEKDTIQYAKDGINFEIMSHVEHTPWAAGAIRTLTPDRTPLEGLRWGLCHKDEGSSPWSYIQRFDTITL